MKITSEDTQNRNLRDPPSSQCCKKKSRCTSRCTAMQQKCSNITYRGHSRCSAKRQRTQRAEQGGGERGRLVGYSLPSLMNETRSTACSSQLKCNLRGRRRHRILHPTSTAIINQCTELTWRFIAACGGPGCGLGYAISQNEGGHIHAATKGTATHSRRSRRRSGA
jgi:hypothetical protein